MATMTKHKDRSRVSFHSEETTKNWFFNRCNSYCGAIAEVKKKRKEKQNG